MATQFWIYFQETFEFRKKNIEIFPLIWGMCWFKQWLVIIRKQTIICTNVTKTDNVFKLNFAGNCLLMHPKNRAQCSFVIGYCNRTNLPAYSTKSLTLKQFCQNVISVSNFVSGIVIFLFETALWLLMTWCFSNRAAVATVLITPMRFHLFMG